MALSLELHLQTPELGAAGRHPTQDAEPPTLLHLKHQILKCMADWGQSTQYLADRSSRLFSALRSSKIPTDVIGMNGSFPL